MVKRILLLLALALMGCAEQSQRINVDDSDYLFRFRLLHELGHWGALRPAYDHIGDWNVMSANPDRRATVPTAADVEYVGL